MECREFLRHLLSYVAGEVHEPLFEKLVEHENGCPVCRAAAAEIDPPAEATLSGASVRPILQRTAGRDCTFIELRMADALDDELSPELLTLVSEHVTGCASCRRMRDVLQSLPALYATLPMLTPSVDFVTQVLARTTGAKPGFLEVLRAIWRKPEAIWEAAAACALLLALVAGDRFPSYGTVSEAMQGASEEVASLGVGVASPIDKETRGKAAELYEGAHQRWQSVESWAVGVSTWGGGVGEHIRSGDSAALLSDIRAVLAPLGLYPRSHNAGDPDGSGDSESEEDTTR